jgi:hypothetical protein
MTAWLPQHLEQVQIELAHKLAEACRIGECLATLSLRLQQEPWKWSIGWLEDAFPSTSATCPVEPDVVEALDKNRLEWLLEDIRILKRREAELKRLAAA